MMPTLSSLLAPDDTIMTTCGTTSDDKIGIKDSWLLVFNVLAAMKPNMWVMCGFNFRTSVRFRGILSTILNDIVHSKIIFEKFE